MLDFSLNPKLPDLSGSSEVDSLIRQHRGFSFGCFPHVLLLLCFVFCARLFVKLFLVHATHVGDRSHSISSA